MPALRSDLCTQMLVYMRDELGWDDGQRLLIAVSGGLDSMALWTLFREAGLDFEIAHCNFNLRGRESDDDEGFMREQATENEVLHCKSFDTLHFSASKGISVQMAAREL